MQRTFDPEDGARLWKSALELVLQATVTQAFHTPHFEEHYTKSKRLLLLCLNDLRFLTCEPTYECLVEIWSFLLSFTS